MYDKGQKLRLLTQLGHLEQNLRIPVLKKTPFFFSLKNFDQNFHLQMSPKQAGFTLPDKMQYKGAEKSNQKFSNVTTTAMLCHGDIRMWPHFPNRMKQGVEDVSELQCFLFIFGAADVLSEGSGGK